MIQKSKEKLLQLWRPWMQHYTIGSQSTCCQQYITCLSGVIAVNYTVVCPGLYVFMYKWARWQLNVRALGQTTSLITNKQFSLSVLQVEFSLCVRQEKRPGKGEQFITSHVTFGLRLRRERWWPSQRNKLSAAFALCSVMCINNNLSCFGNIGLIGGVYV